MVIVFFARGRVGYFHLSIVQVHFVFCRLNFIVPFPYLIKYYNIMFIIVIVFWFGSDKPAGLFFFFAPPSLLSILTPLVFSSSSVYLSYFILCFHAPVFGKTLLHELPISYSHTEWYLFSRNEIILGRRVCCQKITIIILFSVWE